MNTMNRFAMFIDAGYFFAQGSASLTGEVRSRRELDLKEGLAVQTLKDIAYAHLPNQERSSTTVGWKTTAILRTASRAVFGNG